MTKVTMIDPDSGWRYGFPKPVHEEYHTLGDDFNLEGWLVSEGYPQSLVDYWLHSKLGYVPCRMWEQEIDDDGWYAGRAARNNMSSPGDKDYD